jgi:hypothetical protein
VTRPQPRPRARMCRGCGVLLLASQTCEPCDTATVHVITTLGPTDGPGLLVSAKLLPRRTAQDVFDEAMRRDFDTSLFARGPEYSTRIDPDNNPFMRPRRKR